MDRHSSLIVNYWQEVHFNFKLDITDIEYYIECIEVGKCGKIDTDRNYTHDYNVKSERLEDTVIEWIEWDITTQKVGGKK